MDTKKQNPVAVCRMHQEEWNPDPESQPLASECYKLSSEALGQSQGTGLKYLRPYG